MFVWKSFKSRHSDSFLVACMYVLIVELEKINMDVTYRSRQAGENRQIDRRADRQTETDKQKARQANRQKDKQKDR